MQIIHLELKKVLSPDGDRFLRVVISTSKGNVRISGYTFEVEAELANLKAWVEGDEEDFLAAFTGAVQLPLPQVENQVQGPS